MLERNYAEFRDPQCAPVFGYCPRCGGEMYHVPEEDEICEWCERELRIEASMREEAETA